jgi:S1-C subfamily serine protease
MKTTFKVLAIAVVSSVLGVAASAAERLPVGLAPSSNEMRLSPVLSRSDYLGLAIESHNERGLKVAFVSRDGAAASAGLEVGDIIIGADGYYVDSLDELESAARNSYGKLPLVVRDVRTGRTATTTMKITGGVIGNATAWCSGLELMVEVLPRGGLKISGDVERGTLASKLGLKRGDVLLTVNGESIRDVDTEAAFARSFTLTFEQASTGYTMTVKRTVSRW